MHVMQGWRAHEVARTLSGWSGVLPQGGQHQALLMFTEPRPTCLPPLLLFVCALQLSMHEQFPSYMETTLQLATNQGVVLPPRSSAAKSVLSTVGGAADGEVAEMASSSNTHGTGAAALTSACRGAVPHSMLA